MSKYGFGKTVDMSFDAAIEQVTHALQGEGFGVLADIDIAGAMKKKLNQDMPPYRILGACNPPRPRVRASPHMPGIRGTAQLILRAALTHLLSRGGGTAERNQNPAPGLHRRRGITS